MDTYCLIDCRCKRPDWPFMPVCVPCGSAYTVRLIGSRDIRGVRIAGYGVRITNADGVSLTRQCVKDSGEWVATFPASHFQNYGDVKNGVAILEYGAESDGTEHMWICRVGDLRVFPVDASSTPGGQTAQPRDVYHKSEIVDGVQHYKREVLTWSERQRAWGADYVGDYVFVGGDYVPFTGE